MNINQFKSAIPKLLEKIQVFQGNENSRLPAEIQSALAALKDWTPADPDDQLSKIVPTYMRVVNHFGLSQQFGIVEGVTFDNDHLNDPDILEAAIQSLYELATKWKHWNSWEDAHIDSLRILKRISAGEMGVSEENIADTETSIGGSEVIEINTARQHYLTIIRYLALTAETSDGPHMRDEYRGRPALIMAMICLGRYVKDGRNTIINDMLNVPGADPNPRDTRSTTFYHFCLWCRSKDVPKMIIQHITDINAPLPDGETFLTLAVGAGNKKVVEFILEACSDLNLDAKNSDNQTALEIAQDKGNKEIVTMLTNAIEKRSAQTSVLRPSVSTAQAGSSSNNNANPDPTTKSKNN
jgi:hypothetical protein